MNKNLPDHDWIPLFPEIENLLRRAKGNESCDFIESFFEYARGNYDNALRLKRKCRRCLWKAIEDYYFLIDQCYEVTEYAEQDT